MHENELDGITDLDTKMLQYIVIIMKLIIESALQGNSCLHAYIVSLCNECLCRLYWQLTLSL